MRNLSGPLLAALLFLCVPATAAVVAREDVREIGGERVRVYEAYDDAVADRRPGVVVFHHDFSGLDEYTKGVTRRLAEQGYVVLAPQLAVSADFNGAPSAGALDAEQDAAYQKQLKRRSKEAFELLRTDARVQPDRLAAVGFCHLGGYVAMDAARFGSGLSAVVTLWGGVNPKDMSTSWSHRRIKPKVLVLLGGSDVETNPYLESFREEMRAGQADWSLRLYGKAEHGFTMPDPHPDARGKYDADADRQSWRDLTQFLADALAPRP